MAGKKRSISLGADICAVRKELDEALCPICMEHPHNAVLLLCSSHSKGCTSYICDTSYRHSHCLDRFRKLKPDSSISDSSAPPRSTSLLGNEFPGLHGAHNRSERNFESSRDRLEHDEEGVERKSSLKCPLCRGDVLGWKVVEEAREYLNLKPRSCTRESCTFVGNYQELRRHARSVHPRVRPAEVDPSRQRAWRHFERQREHDDIVSAIRSAMPGAVVLGDYMIENTERLPVERERATSDAHGPWTTTLFVFQMLESMQSLEGPRSHPRPWTRHRRQAGGSSRQRYLWGENLLGLQDDEDDSDDSIMEDDELDVFADVAEHDTSPVRRQRRRFSHSRSSRDRL